MFIIGKSELPEFQYALSALPRKADSTFFVEIDAAVKSDRQPEVIILLQSFPGEYSQSDCSVLTERFPLAAIILVYSCWGEGERRTGHPLVGVIRIAWYDFPFWFSAEYALFCSGVLSQLSLPSSASDAQRAILDSQQAFPPAIGKKVWICSDTASQRETTARFFRLTQASVWTGGLLDCPAENSGCPDTILLFPDYLTPAVLSRVSQYRVSFPASQINVLIYQPRLNEINQYLSAGADNVLSCNPDFILGQKGPLILQRANQSAFSSDFRHEVETDLLATEDFIIVKKLKHGRDFWSEEKNRQRLNNILRFYTILSNTWQLENSVEQIDRSLGETLKYAGDAFMQLGDYSQADSAYKSYLKICRLRIDKFPDDTDVQRNYALALLRSVTVLLKSGNPKDTESDKQRRLQTAQQTLLPVLSLFESIAQKKPGNLKSQRNISVVCLMLGDIALLRGERPAAENYYARCRSIRLSLLEQLPDNPQVQRHWQEIDSRKT